MKLKWLFIFLCFSLLFVGTGMSLGDECPEVVDIEQLKCDVTAGFGEFDNSDDKGGVRYRGQGATPGENIKAWTSIEFDIPPSNTDLRVFIDTADSDSIPEHGIDGAIFSFTIPNSELKEGMKYDLPEEFPVVKGTQYVAYLAPYKNGVYCDDYRDMKWGSNNPYCGGKGVVNINGCWIVSDLSSGTIDMKVKFYGRECSVPPPPPPPQEGCVDVEILNLSTRDMEIYIGEETEIVVTVECGEGFSLGGVPIHAKMVRWGGGGKVGRVSLNGLTKKYERQTVLTDDEGKARFAVKGLKDGRLKIKVEVDDNFGFFKDVVKVKVRK